MISFVIILIIAMWFMYDASVLPLSLAILGTIFGVLTCMWKVAKVLIKMYTRDEDD